MKYALFFKNLSFYNELYTVRLGAILGPFCHREGSMAEPSRAEPSRAGTGRAEPSRAEPSRAEPSRAEPGRAEPSRAGPSRAEPGRAEPSRAEPSSTELSRRRILVSPSYPPGGLHGTLHDIKSQLPYIDIEDRKSVV